MAGEDIATTIGNVGQSALSIGLIIIVGIFAIAFLIAVLFAAKYYKRYKQFKITILSKDSFGQVHEEYDDGGVFVDKQTRNKRLYLRKANVGLDPDNIPYITSKKGKRHIYLYRTGLKNFRYIIPSYEDKELSFNHVGEEDVNWAINSYERAKKSFATSMIMQYLPFIILAFVSIVILIMFLYFFQQFSVLKDVAFAFRDAAQATSGTTVLPA